MTDITLVTSNKKLKNVKIDSVGNKVINTQEPVFNFVTDSPKRVRDKRVLSQINKHKKKIKMTLEQHSITTKQQRTPSIKNYFFDCHIDLSKGDYSIKGSEAVEEQSTVPDSNSSLNYPNLIVLPFNFRSIVAENLNLKYARIFSKESSNYIFQRLEKEVEYFSGDLLKVKVYGKWHDIPRKQVSYGDPGLSYAFSGTCIPAIAWSKCSIITHLKKIVESLCRHSFNFVLVNRYKNGKEHMGEHRDDEKDLVVDAPIASLSFGQTRDFIFKHKDSRGTNRTKKINPIKLELEHGSLLLMQWPTNHFWYHSLPVRAKAPNVRINLTFREIVKKN